MKILRSRSSIDGISDLKNRICDEIERGEKVLWLLSGGSNIPIEINAMAAVRQTISGKDLNNLTVSLSDERYGLPGHKDSNWFQLIQNGFDFQDLKTLPILRNASLTDTATSFEDDLRFLFKKMTSVVVQLGIGTDGHIAGILPGSPAERSQNLVCAYRSIPFDRITLTYSALRKADHIFVFAFGQAKREALRSLIGDLSCTSPSSILPCSWLKSRDNVYLYTDQ